MANYQPLTKHWALYKRQPHRTPGLTLWQIIVRLLCIGLGTVVLTLLGPLIPSLRARHRVPTTGEEYLADLLPSFAVALLLASGVVYECIIKPLKEKQLGYRLVGQFAVLGKQELFGKSWLELAPDDTHRVGVTQEAFERFQKGDVVEVVYSATRELISVGKIFPPAARP